MLCELDVSLQLSCLIGIFHNGLNSLQKLESRAQRRKEALQMQSLSSCVDIDTTSAQYQQQQQQQQQHQSSNQLNSFTVFDTYDAYRAYRTQLMQMQITGHELAMLIKEEEEDFVINNSELNITCCIMMLDMIIKQFELQRHPLYLGFGNAVSKELLLLLSKQLILPWTKKHKCKQQYGFLSAESAAGGGGGGAAGGGGYCTFCEEYLVWFSFAKDILTYVSPKLEIELAEINFQYLIDSYWANNKLLALDQLVPSFVEPAGDAQNGGDNSDGDDQDQDQETEEEHASTAKKSTDTNTNNTNRSDPDGGVWVTSYGVYYFKFSQLAPQLQLLHSLLKEFYRVPDIDAFYNLLVCLKMLVIHGDCLDTANKEQKGFLIYCLEKHLIPKYVFIV